MRYNNNIKNHCLQDNKSVRYIMNTYIGFIIIYWL